MIRVAVLSFWHVHGKDYARDAGDHPETELVAIWDEVPERGRAEAAQRGVRFYDDLDELLAQPDIDGVIVTTPTRIHKAVMVAAARAGKHIFTEKVIAATLRDAEDILAGRREGWSYVYGLDVAVGRGIDERGETGHRPASAGRYHRDPGARWTPVCLTGCELTSR